jgi:hypothetical protein
VSLVKEKTLSNQLDEAQRVIMALQDELWQALCIFNMSNPRGPYKMTLTRTDPNYIRALGRDYRPWLRNWKKDDSSNFSVVPDSTLVEEGFVGLKRVRHPTVELIS